MDQKTKEKLAALKSKVGLVALSGFGGSAITSLIDKKPPIDEHALLRTWEAGLVVGITVAAAFSIISILRIYTE